MNERISYFSGFKNLRKTILGFLQLELLSHDWLLLSFELYKSVMKDRNKAESSSDGEKQPDWR